MDEKQVQQQLAQMKKFIIQEAEEKKKEISRKADAECSIEKAKIIRTEKAKILKEYERREKQIEIEKKIKQANTLNDARLAILQARDEQIKQITDEATKRLAQIGVPGEQYKTLLKNLIIQGLHKLGESDVGILVRECDKDIAKSVLDEAVSEYTKRTGVQVKCAVDEKRSLPPPPGESEGQSCSGGLILTSNKGRIICNNTLDARLALVFENKLPDVRSDLFPTSLGTVNFAL